MASGHQRDILAENVALKMRIRELEEEKNEYRNRLEELRRAKNTTVVKREREIIEVNAPRLGQRKDTKDVDIKDETLLDDMKKLSLNANIPTGNCDLGQCDHMPLVIRLSDEVNAVEGDNTALRFQNSQLQERIIALENELSIREATFCQREEELKDQLMSHWTKRHKERVRELEDKLTEFQEANTVLQVALQQQRPTGPDPTFQDQ